jgi:ABC-2 type transport system ATP-binding protein
MITLNQVKKSYGKTAVLSSVSASFADGKIHGLLGINGSGKSTLLRLMAGVYQPDGGSILLDGIDLQKHVEAKSRLYFLSDDPFYGNNETIDNLVAFYKSFYPSFSEEELQKDRVLLQLQESGPLASFSKGMRRKAYIAMAFASGADVLLMDEVFDGLDPTSRKAFKGLLVDFISANPKHSVIIASHSLRELEDIADTFSLLKDGELHSDLYSTNGARLKKIQLAFAVDKDAAFFAPIHPLKVVLDGRFATLYLEGEAAEIEKNLQQFAPLLIQIKDATLEESFLEETEVHL